MWSFVWSARCTMTSAAVLREQRSAFYSERLQKKSLVVLLSTE